MKVRVVAVVALFFAVVATGSGASPATINQHSIGAARLGLTAAQYRQLFGATGLKMELDYPNGAPTGWTKLVFAHPGIAVYFRPHHTRAEIITTWNPRYRTADGIGPCSMLDNVKLTYGKRLKPSRWNTQHGHSYAYVLGKNLMFTPNDSPYINVVGLYDGSAPSADRPGGSYPWAGYITQSERTCHRS
jgi:hypothetical protein